MLAVGRRALGGLAGCRAVGAGSGHWGAGSCAILGSHPNASPFPSHPLMTGQRAGSAVTHCSPVGPVPTEKGVLGVWGVPGCPMALAVQTVRGLISISYVSHQGPACGAGAVLGLCQDKHPVASSLYYTCPTQSVPTEPRAVLGLLTTLPGGSGLGGHLLL